MLATVLRRGRSGPARQRARRATGASRGSADAQPVDADGPSAGGIARPLGDRVQRRARVDGPRAGRARAGGPARCTSGTTFRPTARSDPTPSEPGPVAAVCVQHDSRPARPPTTRSSSRGISRTARPTGCGWDAPQGEGGRVIGNYYCTRFADAWEAARYVGDEPAAARSRARGCSPRRFARARCRPPSRTAPSANLSTLVTQTCFRTADGEFHGFEGCGDTARLLRRQLHARLELRDGDRAPVPELRALAAPRRLRLLDGRGRRHALPPAAARRQRALPHGRRRRPDGPDHEGLSGLAAVGRRRVPAGALAAREAGDRVRLDRGRLGRRPRRRDRGRAAQHVRHRVLRAEPAVRHLLSRRAARGRGDGAARWATRRRAPKRGGCSTPGAPGSTRTCSTASTTSSRCRGSRASTIRAGAAEHDGLGRHRRSPSIRWATGCLVDQLVGQYQADVAGLGPLVDPANCRADAREHLPLQLQARAVASTTTVQRTFALNDEAALVVADYARGGRPDVPFPYYAEVMTGLRVHRRQPHDLRGHGAAGRRVHHQHSRALRRRAAKPVGRAECGSHYARAMAAWTGVLALSGFRYDGPGNARVTALPRLPVAELPVLLVHGTGWGTFAYGPRRPVAASSRCCTVSSPVAR